MIVFSIIAWIMGNGDLAEIRSGRMDPDGEGMTQAGRILGIIAVILWGLAILLGLGYFLCVFVFFVALFGAAVNAPPPNQRRR
jgi:hypothetical protein